VTEKAQRTIQIKWVRSGIGFTYRQKEMVRSLGLRRLSQVVECPDTPQIRGLVARIPHLVTIVDEPPQPAVWAAVPEYTLRPPEVVPAASPAPSEVLPVQEESPIAQAGREELAAEPAATGTVVKSTGQVPATAGAAKAKKPAKSAAKRKAAETKKGKAAAGKTGKSSKAGKK
jgi:large subunit ribosomal protein L30